jgi:hypothetical protein
MPPPSPTPPLSFFPCFSLIFSCIQTCDPNCAVACVGGSVCSTVSLLCGSAAPFHCRCDRCTKSITLTSAVQTRLHQDRHRDLPGTLKKIEKELKIKMISLFGSHFFLLPFPLSLSPGQRVPNWVHELFSDHKALRGLRPQAGPEAQYRHQHVRPNPELRHRHSCWGLLQMRNRVCSEQRQMRQRKL